MEEEPTGSGRGGIRLLRALPNPFRDRTELCFRLSPAAAAGEHRVTWDGLDAAGSRVASGTCFVRTPAGDPGNPAKLVVIR